MNFYIFNAFATGVPIIVLLTVDFANLIPNGIFIY